MQYVRKHPFVLGALGMAFSITMLAIIIAQTALAQQAEETYSVVSEIERQRLLGVLDQAGLDTETAGALNLTAEQAEAILSATRDWFGQNGTALASARENLTNCQRTFRELRRQRRLGRANGQQPSADSARESVRSATQVMHEQLQGLRTALAPTLSESQRAMLATMRKNKGKPMPLRALALTERQWAQIRDVQDIHRAARANGAAAGSLLDAVIMYESAEGPLLSVANRAVLAALETHEATSTENWGTAIDLVLPLAAERARGVSAS